MSVKKHEIDRETEHEGERTEHDDPMTTTNRTQTEGIDSRRGRQRPLNGIVDELQQVGAERVRVVLEDGEGHRYDEQGTLLLEVTALYDHWGLEEGLRRRLEAIAGPVQWNGTEWDLEPRVGERTDPNDAVTIYDRFR